MKIASIVISWLVVILVTSAIMWINTNPERFDKLKESSAMNGPDWQFEFMAKYTLGSARAMKPSAGEMVRQFSDRAANTEQQIAAAIVEGEVLGKDAAIKQLKLIGGPQAKDVISYYDEKIDHLELPEFEKHYPWHYRLINVYGVSDSKARREQVLTEADWMFRGVFIGIFGLIFVGAIGFVLLITGIIMLATGKICFRTQRVTERGHVYIEAFAIFMALFVVVSFVSAILPKGLPLGIRMIPVSLIFIFSGAWPMMREIKFADYRKTVGMHLGRGLFTEIFWGITGYIAGLPLVAIGFIITIILTTLTKQTTTHPISFEINEMSSWLLFGMAAVFAPLTEELLFRGIFVSHLRSWTGVLVSAAISGFIFAAIHPQGWMAIPVLGIMGFNFAIIRQWRDSLIPSITAHALNNGLLVAMLITIAK